MPLRRFIVAPREAEWATVRLIAGAMPRGPHSIILHAVPSARGDLPNTEIQTKRMLALREHAEETVTVPVRGGSTLELCLQLSWLANPASVELEAIVDFHSFAARGVAAHPPSTHLPPSTHSLTPASTHCSDALSCIGINNTRACTHHARAHPTRHFRRPSGKQSCYPRARQPVHAQAEAMPGAGWAPRSSNRRPRRGLTCRGPS